MSMKIALLMGGVSSEREVSLRSGQAVADALCAKGMEVRPIDVRSESLDDFVDPAIDLYFIALHGGFGEDGRLQRAFEERGICFTGSGAAASALAMDKCAAKEIFLRNAIPTPPFRTIEPSSTMADVGHIAGELGFPLVLKPRSEGSSVGVSIHHDPRALEKGFRDAAQGKQDVLMERYIAGKELTVGILEDRPLPPIQLIPRQSFYDYTAKYRDTETQYLVNPPIPPEIAARAREIALSAHKALGCRCLSRVDIMLASDGGLFALEVNTVPGLTDRSLLPKAARAAGIEFPDLCLKIVNDALRRSGRTDR
ncbi:MAG: hypothetical protein A2Z34_04780 [Planctomycetes bacterium RBG_16_59_8]|nr:MAG: hypothetical protein A2Z34_04780 [Planctomycetes bacterium RBG_16_59_8]